MFRRNASIRPIHLLKRRAARHNPNPEPFQEPNMPTNGSLNRKLRMALVGGGQGAFIGRVHATAAILDNRAVLVAGALSSDPQKARASAPDFDIKPERAY